MVSKIKKDKLLKYHNILSKKAETHKTNRDIHAYENFRHQIKGIRKTLDVLKISIYGINTKTNPENLKNKTVIEHKIYLD